MKRQVRAAIARGVVVVFCAGNGHYAFPGSIPEVIYGVYIDAQGKSQAPVADRARGDPAPHRDRRHHGSRESGVDLAAQGIKAGTGADGATGAGLVAAFAAWQQVNA